MRRILPVALLLLAVPAMSGCGPRMFALGAGMVIGAAVVASHEPREVVVYEPAPTYVVVQPQPYVPPPAPTDRAPAADPPSSFDIGAARGALARVDLGGCRDAGAPHGYGHARVTFDSAGAVTKVAIDAPSGLEPRAVQCIGNALGTAAAPTFDGGPVTVPTTFYVR